MIATQPSAGIVLAPPMRRTGVLTRLREATLTSRVMLVATMVSMVAFLDTTVVNLALPATRATSAGACACNNG